MKTAPEIIQDEFIGLNAKVTRSRNPCYVGISGRVVNETRNILVLLHNNKEKAIVKEVSVFHLRLPHGTVIEIDGKLIVGRPEDRVKKKIRRRW